MYCFLLIVLLLYWATYLELFETSMKELFCQSSWRPLAIICFCKIAPSQMFGRVLIRLRYFYTIQWTSSDVCSINSKQIRHTDLVFFIRYFEQVFAGRILNPANIGACIEQKWSANTDWLIQKRYRGNMARILGFYKNHVINAKYIEKTHMIKFNPLKPNVPFLYPLKTSENFWFFNSFRECRNVTLCYNRLRCRKECHCVLK